MAKSAILVALLSAHPQQLWAASTEQLETCNQQSACITWTTSVIASASKCNGDCAFEVCMTLSDKDGCGVDNGHALSHTCVAQDTCNPSIGASSNQGISVGGQNHRQCQVGTVGSVLTFVLKQSNACEALTASPITLPHGSVTCAPRHASDASCSGGGNIGRECMWKVTLPGTCSSVSECPAGQHLNGIQCQPNCKCENGTPETRPECNNEHDCFECDSGYHMSANGKECKQDCYCVNGDAVDSTVCSGGHQCERCDPGYELDPASKLCNLKCRVGYHPSPDGKICQKNCYCKHGDPFDGKVCNGEHHCEKCDENYQLDEETKQCKVEAYESMMPSNYPKSFPNLNVRLSAIKSGHYAHMSGLLCAGSGMLFTALLSYGVRRYRLTPGSGYTQNGIEPSLLSQGESSF